jgi:hypothetical protein
MFTCLASTDISGRSSHAPETPTAVTVNENSTVFPVTIDEGPRKLAATEVKYGRLEPALNTADSPDAETTAAQHEVGREDDRWQALGGVLSGVAVWPDSRSAPPEFVPPP